MKKNKKNQKVHVVLTNCFESYDRVVGAFTDKRVAQYVKKLYAGSIETFVLDRVPKHKMNLFVRYIVFKRDGSYVIEPGSIEQAGDAGKHWLMSGRLTVVTLAKSDKDAVNEAIPIYKRILEDGEWEEDDNDDLSSASEQQTSEETDMGVP